MAGRELTKEKFLNKAEHAELVRVLNLCEVRDFRNVTLLRMLLHTGARISEVLGIRGLDVNSDTCSVFITGLKHSKNRDIPLTLPLLFDIKKLIRGPDERIFDIGYNRARDIWAEYRPVKKRIHSLRHWRAMDVYEKSKDIRLVQTVLGHRYLSNTMIYLDYQHNLDELRRALI